MPFWVILIKYKYLLQSTGSQSSHICHLCSVCWLNSICYLGLKKKKPRISSLFSFLIPFYAFLPFFPFQLRRHTLETERADGWVFMGLIKTHFKNIQVCFLSGYVPVLTSGDIPTRCETVRQPAFVSDGFQYEPGSNSFQSIWVKKKKIFLLCYKLGLSEVEETQYFNV